MTRLSKQFFLVGLVLFSVLSLVSFGILGVGREGTSNSDGMVLYAAGRAWLSGANPYHHSDLVQSSIAYTGSNLEGLVFFYPPQSSLICMLQGMLDYSQAKLLWLLTNLLSVSAIVATTVFTIRRLALSQMGRTGAWVISAIAVGNPFTTHVVWMGQTSLLACATMMGAWFFSRQDRWLWSGLCLGLATFKPQICVLLVLWFLLEKQWRILLTAGATIIGLSLYPMLTQGPIGMLVAWKNGIHESYQLLVFNTPGFQHKAGVQSMLASAGISVPSLTLLAVALTILVWFWRKHINPEDILAILTAITFCFVGYTHDYDYVCLIPIFTALWLHCYDRPKRWLLILPLLFLLFVPQRAIRITDVPVLNHWRTPIVLAFLVVLVAFNLDYASLQLAPISMSKGERFDDDFNP
ncbi:glycosyltransferase family 87 protein [Phormidesmis priestleyi]